MVDGTRRDEWKKLTARVRGLFISQQGIIERG